MRLWWHNAARKHTLTMSKPGVGDIMECMNRFTGETGVHVRPDDGRGDVLYLDGATEHDVSSLGSAITATDLRNRFGHAVTCVECC